MSPLSILNLHMHLRLHVFLFSLSICAFLHQYNITEILKHNWIYSRYFNVFLGKNFFFFIFFFFQVLEAVVPSFGLMVHFHLLSQWWLCKSFSHHNVMCLLVPHLKDLCDYICSTLINQDNFFVFYLNFS